MTDALVLYEICTLIGLKIQSSTERKIKNYRFGSDYLKADSELF